MNPEEAHFECHSCSQQWTCVLGEHREVCPQCGQMNLLPTADFGVALHDVHHDVDAHTEDVTPEGLAMNGDDHA